MRSRLLLSDLELSWSIAVQLPEDRASAPRMRPSRLNRHPEVLWHPDDGPELPELETYDWGRPRYAEPCVAWL